MASDFLCEKHIKDYCRTKDRRVGQDFMTMLDEKVREFLQKACAVHNGSKVTLDIDVAGYVGLNREK